MTNHPIADMATDPPGEDLAAGATWLLDLVAAVDHLHRGYRPGITAWDAFTEALCWHLDLDEPPPGDLDTLGHALARLAQPDVAAAPQLQAALRRWVTTMANRYNNGHHWPHPVARRGFPPPQLDV